jgi:hypothetical protein
VRETLGSQGAFFTRGPRDTDVGDEERFGELLLSLVYLFFSILSFFYLYFFLFFFFSPLLLLPLSSSLLFHPSPSLSSFSHFIQILGTRVLRIAPRTGTWLLLCLLRVGLLGQTRESELEAWVVEGMGEKGERREIRWKGEQRSQERGK